MYKVITPEDAVTEIKSLKTQNQVHDLISLPKYGGDSDIEQNIEDFINEHYNYYWSPYRHIWLTSKDVPTSANGGYIKLIKATPKQAKQFVISAITAL